MITLTDKDIAEFQALFKKEPGQDITATEAAEYAERLVRLVAWVAAEAGPIQGTDTLPASVP